MNEKIGELMNIILELDARESTNNCVFQELIDKSWNELCDRAIELFNQLKG